MTCWARKTRTFEEARVFLATRYKEQAECYPTMRKTTPRGVYIGVNLRAARIYYTEVAP